MHTLLFGCEDLNIFAYLDDIVICAKSLDDMLKKLRIVFLKFREYNLKLQPSKCQFLRKEVTYLGHKLTEKGNLTNQKLSVFKIFLLLLLKLKSKRF